MFEIGAYLKATERGSGRVLFFPAGMSLLVFVEVAAQSLNGFVSILELRSGVSGPLFMLFRLLSVCSFLQP